MKQDPEAARELRQWLEEAYAVLENDLHKFEAQIKSVGDDAYLQWAMGDAVRNSLRADFIEPFERFTPEERRRLLRLLTIVEHVIFSHFDSGHSLETSGAGRVLRQLRKRAVILVDWEKDVRPQARRGMEPAALLKAYRAKYKLPIDPYSFKRTARDKLKEWFPKTKRSRGGGFQR